MHDLYNILEITVRTNEVSGILVTLSLITKGLMLVNQSNFSWSLANHDGFNQYNGTDHLQPLDIVQSTQLGHGSLVNHEPTYRHAIIHLFIRLSEFCLVVACLFACGCMPQLHYCFFCHSLPAVLCSFIIQPYHFFRSKPF